MRRKIVAVFNDMVHSRSSVVHYELSFFEKRNQAIFMSRAGGPGQDGLRSHGEIAHIHPADGSMHMIFSRRDAKAVIEGAWGELHPLAGQMGLPDTYVMVYPPRNDGELAVTSRLLAAAIDHQAGTR